MLNNLDSLINVHVSHFSNSQLVSEAALNSTSLTNCVMQSINLKIQSANDSSKSSLMHHTGSAPQAFL
jgi:hypothetical protein